MNATRQFAVLVLITVLLPVSAAANTQLVLDRDATQNSDLQYTGVVDLTIKPGFDKAKVTVIVDGQKIADGLVSPYHVVVDFGPAALQHRITIIATAPNGKRAQWSETVNQGYLPLSLKVNAVDPASRLFEAETTTPKDDPIEAVQLWENGQVIATANEAPYRFTVPESMMASGFVQVTAKTKSGDEAADFWSAAGNVHSEELQVRTVPIFVSVVDRNGHTRTDVDRSHFRIMDESAEATIIEFGKAFDQPISIALVLEKNRRAIVILTDGSDTASTWSYDEVQELAREAAIPLYFIAYEGGRENVARELDRLQFLAAETGGFVATATQQNLLAKYTDIEKDLRAQFAILYQVSDFGKSNQYRRVQVMIDSPKLSARTIKGYFTP